MRVFRMAMVQMNPTVGDLVGNAEKISMWIKEAKRAKADLVAFPELCMTAYPPEDLVLKPQFVDDNWRLVQEVATKCEDLAAVVGYVSRGDIAGEPPQSGTMHGSHHDIFNAAAVMAGGRVVSSYCKHLLPNYGVFDENRYFLPGQRLPIYRLRGTTFGVNICEDIWLPEGPIRAQAEAGAKVIVNINASPFHVGKSRYREQMLATRARDNNVIVTYTNIVGGQDELVFDGNSVIVDQTGEVVARAKCFEEDLLIADLNVDQVSRQRLARGRKRFIDRKSATAIERVELKVPKAEGGRRGAIPSVIPLLSELEEVYEALVVGIHDYVRKNGFRRVVVGLSGGIDSALAAVVVVDALGSENLLGVFMPSPYTSRESHEDVLTLARRLQIELKTIPITGILRTYLHSLARSFKDQTVDKTEENVQARIRGNLLMAISNKFGHLVVTTGNKSELSVGYATLYGDMAGGFAVIKDVPKMMVYELAKFRNSRKATAPIPKRIFERAPTAELRPNQKDEDSLPPYAILDPILKAYIEEDRSMQEIVALGFAHETVEQVIRMVDQSEYKRRQAPIGIKITHRAFGKDRRMPITNQYRPT